MDPVWARDYSKIYLGSSGDIKVVGAGGCEQRGNPVREIRLGRVFSLTPSVPGALNKPWTSAEISTINPYEEKIGQKAFEAQGSPAKLRWTREGPTEIVSMEGSFPFNAAVFNKATLGCSRALGLTRIGGGNDATLACSGLSDTGGLYPQFEHDPALFLQSGTFLTLENSFQDWRQDVSDVSNPFYGLYFTGATASENTRRQFFVGGDFGEVACQFSDFRCYPSQLHEINPDRAFARNLLTAGDKQKGFFFLGSPAVGSGVTEPILDRYVVWLADYANDVSLVLNKYDRYLGQTTSIGFDPDRGAHPVGPLIDLGNGQSIGRLKLVPSTLSPTTNLDSPSPYLDKLSGFNVVNRATGEASLISVFPSLFSLFRNPDVYFGINQLSIQEYRYSDDLNQLADGSVWAMAWVKFSTADAFYFVTPVSINPGTGAVGLPFLANQLSTRFVGKAKDDEPLASPSGRDGVLYFTYHPQFQTADAASAPAPDGSSQVACIPVAAPASAKTSEFFGPGVDQVAPPIGRFTERAPIVGLTATSNATYLMTTARGDGTPSGAIFAIDRNVSAANLCAAPPVLKRMQVNLPDVPSTRMLKTQSGDLYYGTTNGKLMRFDPNAGASGTVTEVANLAAGAGYTSVVKGYLSEIDTDVIGVIVYDYDASGNNVARRLAGVSKSGSVGNLDLTQLLDEKESYPGVGRL
jgi:hypothetical protein